MNDPAVIRLLCMGLPGQPDIAAPFSKEELALSPLALPNDTPEQGWTAREKDGLRWLERPMPGLPAPLYITGPSSSSLDMAKSLLLHGLFPEWASVLCLSQSAGRGQMRREWASPAGNIYAALRIPTTGPFATFAAAPAIGGLVAEALLNEGFPVLLKWPNDLLQASTSLSPGTMPGRTECRKVGGILLEERQGALIAGIGLNIASAPSDSTLRDNYVFSAGVLTSEQGSPPTLPSHGKTKESGTFVTIFTLWKQLVGNIVSCYAWNSTPDSWWPSLAEKHLAFRGCRIRLTDACPEDDSMTRVPCVGVIDGVASSGALRLRTEYGTETFLGGSLLPGNVPFGDDDV